jgi:hypothetical protein
MVQKVVESILKAIKEFLVKYYRLDFLNLNVRVLSLYSIHSKNRKIDFENLSSQKSLYVSVLLHVVKFITDLI